VQGTELTIAQFVLGLLFCTPRGGMDLPPDVATSVRPLAAASFLRSADTVMRVCRVFGAGVPPGRRAESAREALAGARAYIFASLNDRREHLALRDDISDESLPAVIDGEVPTWDADVVATRGAVRRTVAARLAAAAAATAAAVTVDGLGGVEAAEVGALPSTWEDALEDGDQTGGGADVLHVPLVDSNGLVPIPQFFLGAAGSGAPWHYHHDALNTLLHGTKWWALTPPPTSNYSTVPAADFVLHQLPHLPPAAAPLQCVQAAGDVLFVPHGWGHVILNLNTSIGFALEFNTPLHRY